MRAVYERRRGALIHALNTRFGNQITISGESAGMYLMAKLNTGLDDLEVIERAWRVGIGMVSLREFYLEAKSTDAFIFGYSEMNERRIKDSVRKLQQVLGE